MGPLRRLENEGTDELEEVLSRAMSIGIVWSPLRRPAVLELASAAAHRRARLYLIGPPELGQDLGERAWLRDHAGRLLSRRGLACAADLLLLNSGSARTAILFLHEGPRTFWIWLSEQQAEAAADWFSHLFWHQTIDEGRTQGGGYRFQRCAPPPFVVPPLPPEAPLWLTPGPLPAADSVGHLVHDPARAPDRGLPAFVVNGHGGCLDARAAAAGGWSLRLRLDSAQARDLHAAVAVLIGGG